MSPGDTSQSPKYEENFNILERITESLNKDEISIDDLVEKTREALNAARTCMDILNKQKGEFTRLEAEFSQLLQQSNQQASQQSEQQSEQQFEQQSDQQTHSGQPPQPVEPVPSEEYEGDIGQDDPF